MRSGYVGPMPGRCLRRADLDARGWRRKARLHPQATARRISKVSSMEQRLFGRTGVSVSPLCLGAMMFGSWGNPDHKESIEIVHRALDAGINLIDTADVYS